MKRILAAILVAFAVSAHAGLETGTYINDLVATNPPGSDPRAQGADHLRLIKSTIQATFPFMAGTMSRSQSKGSNYVVTTTDNQSLIKATAVINVTFPASSTLTNGFRINVYASSGIATLVPNGVETINGSATFAVPSGYVVTVWSDGSNLFSTLPSGGAVAGTVNQITATLSGATTTLSLPSAVTMPGSLVVTTTLGVTGNETIGGNAVANPKLTLNGTDASYKFLEYQSVGVVKWQAYSEATTHNYAIDSNSVRALTITQAGAVTIPLTLSVTGLTDVASSIRATGFAAPASGSGVETLFSGGIGTIQAYNRTGAAYLPLEFRGTTVSLSPSGSAVIAASAGAATITGTLGVSGKASFNAGNNTTAFDATAATTGYTLGRISNTGGGIDIGVENSAGGAMVVGGGAYDSVIRTITATHLWLSTNAGVPQVKITHTASANRWVTVTGSNGGVPTISTSAGALNLVGNALGSSGTNIGFGGGLTTGRTATFDAASLQAISGWSDSDTLEISTASTAGYVSGISMTGFGATLFPATIRFAIKSAEVARFTAGGFFKGDNAGAYTGLTTNAHGLRTTNDAGNEVLTLVHAGATTNQQYGMYVKLNGDPNNASNYFAQFVGNATTRAVIWSDGSIDSKTMAVGTNSIKVASTAFVSAFHQQITASLGADVNLNNTANYFAGPSVAQGSSGTWFATGTVTVMATTAGSGIYAKLWDGTTVIDSGAAVIPTTSGYITITLSGYLATPAGNLRIDVKDISSTDGKILFNQSGNSKDSTISAFKVAN